MKELFEECDFCGEEFPADEVDSEMAEHDFCVCPNCVPAAREQLILMGDIEEDEEEYEDF
jgi:NAD-dependent SIR2 family protein deacetylase